MTRRREGIFKGSRGRWSGRGSEVDDATEGGGYRGIDDAAKGGEEGDRERGGRESGVSGAQEGGVDEGGKTEIAKEGSGSRESGRQK
ncbi:hypothetical protein Sjap_004645 [Stephania japonica]|uniref:Uncharacterized protein n=1 Tax=Stephania japonica TaxID=461633 RepID=A0AAP0PHZ9_9MAGN